MTNTPEDGRTDRVVAAASRLRVPVTPPLDLWPAILARIGRPDYERRRAFPWAMRVVIVLSLLLAAFVVYSKVATYRASQSVSAAAADPLRLSLYRAKQITSDHDRASALIALSKPAAGDTALVKLIIAAAMPIESSADKADVLVSLGKNRAIRTVSARSAFVSAAESISSEAERGRALDALDR